jgi:hypothetical protein
VGDAAAEARRRSEFLVDMDALLSPETPANSTMSAS